MLFSPVLVKLPLKMARVNSYFILGGEVSEKRNLYNLSMKTQL